MKDWFDVQLLLFLLYKSHFDKSSYKIVQILTWRFKIINFKEIIDFALQEELIIRTKIDNMEGFEITEKGKARSESDEKELEEYLRFNYPEQKPLIDIFFPM